MKSSVVKFFAGSGIRLAVLSVLFLGMAGACMAQASAAAAQPARAAVSVSAPAAAIPGAQPAAQTGQTPAAKGTHEGIKVHGHWTIETRNPDGKVVTHREFENSLASKNGTTILANLLTGEATIGDWLVELETTTPPPVTGPCGTGGAYPCVLGPSGSSAFSGTNSAGFTTAATCAAYGNCFSTVQVSLVSVGQGDGLTDELQITGTATATGTGQIGYVETQANTCIGAPPALSPVPPSTCFTATPVNGFLTFTDATLSTPVPVSAGQTISVTVLISFQ